MPTLDRVFGISTTPVLSYVERPEVDGKFLHAIRGQHHLVIYGASKQGKTTLRQKHVDEDRCITYRCNLKSTSSTIYQSILKDAGISIQVSEVKSDGVKGGGKGSWTFKAMLPWVGGTEATGEVSTEASRETERTVDFVETDFGDSQMIASLLRSAAFDKLVVLENFHYLTKEVQKDLAIDLKTFHEMSIRFIILGVWREANLLFIDNPDLQERVVEVPVEPWSDRDFDKVIEAGAKELNVDIPISARQEFKNNSYGNVGLLQEFLKTYCRLNDVERTLGQLKKLGEGEVIPRTLASKAQDQRGRLLSVLEGISSNSRSDKKEGRQDPLTLPYYLVHVLLTAPINEIHDGITRHHLLEKLRVLHRRADKNSIRAGDVVHLLKRLPALQAETPSPFLYQANQMLRVADAGLLFALANCNREELRDEILDPLEAYDE